ncbi:formate/nitrite transporter family protein, partial [Klebsiella pneumoniae]|uniref:formate/nitrite transporter family protein n=1 Tax=Klebsiella pneumoniae TaxID=573 RepID=UPI003FD3DB36
AMWMPIMLFFFMGFEHSVVNMFLLPSAMIMGGDFSVMDYMLWNEIPTALFTPGSVDGALGCVAHMGGVERQAGEGQAADQVAQSGG